MKISVVIPANNEMHAIRDVVRSCRAYCQEVIVVDDGSTDDTAQVSRTAGAKVIRNAANCGLVKSTRLGLRVASGDKWCGWYIHQYRASNHSSERGRNHSRLEIFL